MSEQKMKRGLLASTMLFGLAGGFWSAAAVAQETTSDEAPVVVEEEEEEDSVQEKVVVTGSRIQRSEFTSISPVQFLEGEVSRDLGLVNADEVLRQTSVVQGQQTTIGLSTNLATGQAFTTFGSVTPSLRGLSSSVTGRTRNLFLVNGRRYGPIGVGGAPANPDVSLIPGSLIQRVDILLDGASSVYGSDAIAGAINYVLRDDIEGLEIDAFYDSPQIGAGDQFVVSATFGIRGDNGFSVFAAEFNSNDDITRADRFDRYLDPVQTADFGTLICDPELEINTLTGEVFNGCSGGLSDFAVFGPLGTVIVTPGETNIGVPGFSALGTAPFDGPDSQGTFGSINNPFTRFFPQDQQVPIRPKTQRYSLYALGEYTVNDLPTTPTFYYEFSYAERTLEQFSVAQGVLEVTGDTPGNPGIGSTLLVPQLTFDINQNIDVFRLTGGVRGELPWLDKLGPLSNWSYDGYALFHRSRGTQSTFGDLSNNNVARVLNGTTDANGQFTCALDETLEGQQPSRAGPGGGFTTPITNCDAVNFFDPLFLTTGRFSDPASNDFILTNAIQNTLVDQLTVNAFITGELFTLPTASTPIQAVFGGEYRLDEVVTVNDENQSTSNALATLNPDVGSIGDRSIAEFFTELSIPLVEDKPFVKSLAVEAAARFTHEEFAGSAWTWQAKGAYSPTDWLQFAGGYGTSFRAPDTGEQFGTGIIFANNTRQDPCLPSPDTLATAGPNTVVNGVPIPENTIFFDETLDERNEGVISLCEQLGVQLPSGPLDVDGAAALGLFGIGTPSASFQNFSVLFGNSGNPQLDPETSDAWFLKASFDQPWFDSFNLRLSANYFDYEVQGSIGQLTAGVILGQCFATDNINGVDVPRSTVVNGELVGNLCQFQSRSPTTGLLTAVNESSFNLGVLTSRGIDFNMEFSTELEFLNKIPGFGGLEEPLDLSVVYRGTLQLENNEDINGEGDFEQNLGLFGFPEYQHNVTAQLGYDRFSFLYRVFYSTPQDSGVGMFGGGNLCIPELTARGEDTSGCTEFIDLPAVILHDLTATYRADTWAFRVGVRNLLDTVIVRDAGGTPSDGGTGTPFGLGFDLDGRNFFVNVTKAF